MVDNPGKHAADIFYLFNIFDYCRYSKYYSCQRKKPNFLAACYVFYSIILIL